MDVIQSLAVWENKKTPLFFNKRKNVLEQHWLPAYDSSDLTLLWTTRRGRKSLCLSLLPLPLFVSPSHLLGVAGCGWRKMWLWPPPPCRPSLLLCMYPFFARFFTLLPQLSWQRIPTASGSHRPHKLIRHLLESSADSEAGRFMANISVRDRFKGLSERRRKLNAVIARMEVISEMMKSKTVSRLQSDYIEDVWPLLAPIHQRDAQGLCPSSPFSRAQALALMGSSHECVLCLVSALVAQGSLWWSCGKSIPDFFSKTGHIPPPCT